MATLGGAVELLDRSLSYTRLALAGLSQDELARPTPCTGWDLGRLLAHMEDSLDAFSEAAVGRVRLAGDPHARGRVGSLQEKACVLLGAWSDDPPAQTRIGDRLVDTSLLALAAALEISVHGWDVARARGLDHPLPDDLAGRLLPVAGALVSPEDRGTRFAVPLVAPSTAGGAARLLAFLGRDLTGPPGQVIRNPDTGPRIAS